MTVNGKLNLCYTQLNECYKHWIQLVVGKKNNQEEGKVIRELEVLLEHNILFKSTYRSIRVDIMLILTSLGRMEHLKELDRLSKLLTR